MSFWNTSEGEAITQSAEFEAPSGGGNYVFADGSTIAGVIEDIKWDSFNGGLEFINYRISVMQPIEDANGVKVANRKIFAKLYLNGKDQDKADDGKLKKQSDTAKRMLAAISTNAGGGLFKVTGQPTNEDLQQHLMMKPMTFRLGKWEMKRQDGTMGVGNYVQAVGPFKAQYDAVSGTTEQQQPKVQASTISAPAGSAAAIGDDIPW